MWKFFYCLYGSILYLQPFQDRMFSHYFRQVWHPHSLTFIFFSYQIPLYSMLFTNSLYLKNLILLHSRAFIKYLFSFISGWSINLYLAYKNSSFHINTENARDKYFFKSFSWVMYSYTSCNKNLNNYFFPFHILFVFELKFKFISSHKFILHSFFHYFFILKYLFLT